MNSLLDIGGISVSSRNVGFDLGSFGGSLTPILNVKAKDRREIELYFAAICFLQEFNCRVDLWCAGAA